MRNVFLTGLIIVLLFTGQSFTHAADALQEAKEKVQVLTEFKNQKNLALAKKESSFKSLLAQKEEKVKKAQAEKKQLEVLQKRLTVLRQQVTKKNNEIKQYRQKNKYLLNGTNAQKNKYKKQLAQLQKQYKNIQKNVTAQKNKISKVNVSYTNTKKTLRKTNQEITSTKNNISDLKLAVKNSNKDLKKLQAYIKNELAKLEHNNDSVNPELQPDQEVKPETKPEAQAELQMFTEHANVLRTYEMGEGYLYNVLNDYEKYWAVITYDNKVLGGYETEVGKNFHGINIGIDTYENLEIKDKVTKYTNDLYMKNIEHNLHMYLHFDQHENNKTRAIEWWSSIPAYKEQVAVAQRFISSNSTDVSMIYRDLANEFRLKNNLGPLEEIAGLTKAAKEHSEDMATRDFYDHTTPDGISIGDRIKRNIDFSVVAKFGYGYGENIAANYRSIFVAHNAWINSSGHRSNLLNQKYKYIGFGVGFNKNSQWGAYYTTNFVYY